MYRVQALENICTLFVHDVFEEKQEMALYVEYYDRKREKMTHPIYAEATIFFFRQ